MRVFISHHNKDSGIVEILVRLLRLSLNLRAEDIRCTSLDGYRLPVGADSEETFRREVHDAEVLIGVITPYSIESGYVLFQIGARWKANKPLFPLLASGATSSHLEGPLLGLNALHCSTNSQINQLVEDIAASLSVTAIKAFLYEDMMIELVKASGTVENLTSVTQVEVPQTSTRQHSVEDRVLLALAGDAVYRDGELSIADLGLETEASRVKVEVAVETLLKEGLISHVSLDSNFVGLTSKGKEYIGDGGLA